MIARIFQGRKRARLAALSVVLVRSEGVEVDVIKTAHVYGKGGGAIGSVSASKRTNSARLAEQVMNDFFIELIIGELIFSLYQGKRAGWYKR